MASYIDSKFTHANPMENDNACKIEVPLNYSFWRY